MAGVINDIEELAGFRAHLMQFNTELTESFAAIRSHWRELGEVWRDDMYQRFGEALEEVTPGIERYLAAAEGHEAHLAALIEHLRGYLEAGYGTGGYGTGGGRAGNPRRGTDRRTGTERDRAGGRDQGRR